MRHHESLVAVSLALLAGTFAAGCGSSKTKPLDGSVPTGAGGTKTDAGGTKTDTAGTKTDAVTVTSGESVLMHHKNLNRDGVYIQPTLTKAAAAGLTRDTSFNPTLSGMVYAQPLFVDAGGAGPDLLIVATESNNVYAFDAASGAQVWMRNLGKPVPLSKMPCGNIDMYGVTSTPVIDLGSRTLFVAGMVSPDDGTTKQHKVFALSLDDGAIKTGWPVDMATSAKSGATKFEAAAQSQRGALALVNGTLFVTYGGLYGDCGNFHGWVVAIPTGDPTAVQSWATSALAGGIWGPSGVASDGTSVYVTSGNTFVVGNTWGGGEALLRFPVAPTLTMTPSYWAPTNWKALDEADLDLSGAGPLLFDLPGATPAHLAAAFGKDGKVYLADPAALPGVGAPLASLQAVNGAIITAATVYTTATATYLAFRGEGARCSGGTSGDLTTVKVVPGSPPTLVGSWCAPAGHGGSMVTTTDGHANAIVWVVNVGGTNLLNGFDGDTGAVVFNGGGVRIAGARSFNPAIAAKGRIFVAADNAVVAFKP